MRGELFVSGWFTEHLLLSPRVIVLRESERDRERERERVFSLPFSSLSPHLSSQTFGWRRRREWGRKKKKRKREEKKKKEKKGKRWRDGRGRGE